jgi:Mn2+/Fe2+ NRAMP family transporter
LTLLVIPMLAIVQSVAAHVGVVSKKGLEDCVRFAYGRTWAIVALAALLIVNILTLAADLEGGGAALGILTRTDYRWWVLPLGAGAVLVLVYGNYRTIERVLRYIALLFLTYVGAAFLSHPDWAAVLRGSFVPHFDLHPATVSGALALLGTTLTAYAYVWETPSRSQPKGDGENPDPRLDRRRRLVGDRNRRRCDGNLPRANRHGRGQLKPRQLKRTGI